MVATRIYRARRLGGLPNATEPLTNWLKDNPREIGVALALAEDYRANGEVDRAIKVYEQVAEDPRPNAAALNNLAWLYHQKGDRRASEVGKRAYEAAPQVPAIADTYGWILVETGNAEAGLPILRKAAAAAANAPEIRYHYAAALAKVGQRDAARRELEALLATSGEYSGAAEAQKLLGELGG
jgi:Tfp pilus assembly protein PilF